VPKVIPFHNRSHNSARQARQPVDAAFLERPDAHSHAVQVYESEELLFDTVGRFLGAGLTEGDRLLVAAHPDHTKGFLARIERDMPADVASAVSSGQLVCLDASVLLADFMVGEKPDAKRFHDVIGHVLGALAGGTAPAPRIRAYGEMVDLLWRMGNFTAAIEVEKLWNEAGERHSSELLCAYLVGHFYKEQRAANTSAICDVHTHVLTPERA
jgi:hypothetical protein